MPSHDPEERTIAARIAANARWAREDPTVNAERGQRGLLARFEKEVDPNGVLDPAVRAKRAEHARRAHMLRLSLMARKTRTRKAADHGPDAA
jgi:hypothetical protein